jgi:hypothetical protein
MADETCDVIILGAGQAAKPLAIARSGRCVIEVSGRDGVERWTADTVVIDTGCLNNLFAQLD